VYIKRLELTNFKSFGGKTAVPLLPGFTVISGPNGSGKSNLIDALLFCLGLAGSKGMRAERLPDLVNQTQTARSRSTIEANVTVTFDLSDEPDLLRDVEAETHSNAQQLDLESTAGNGSNGHNSSNGHNPNLVITNGVATNLHEWSVTRKLRVTQQGTYTSNYYINGNPCTLTELHEALSRLRVYPEGYNVVLQGDVTRIISMNSRERREIIDELAGVATFDRKIAQAKEKLDTVKDREDKYHIVERELIDQRDRLAQDRIKAEKYQKLRRDLQTKEQWEAVILYRQAVQSVQHLQTQIVEDEGTIARLTAQLTSLTTDILQTSTQLEQLNARVKALGEEDHLALQASLATREAELRQLQRQQHDLQAQQHNLTATLTRQQQDLHTQQQTLAQLTETQAQLETHELATLRQQRQTAQHTLEQQRDALSASAASAEAWVKQQTELRHQVDTLLSNLEPQRAEQTQLQERLHQIERQIQEQTQTHQQQSQRLTDLHQQQAIVAEQLTHWQQQVQTLANALTNAEQEFQLQQDTQTRLLHEQRDKQRRLDKLEAQTQAMREAQGTQATQVILEMGLSGVCGLVAQLGRVEPRYQLALETAAGGRLGNLVVEDDSVAAAGIEILKRQRAGRATFLPLNKIKPGRQITKDGVRSLQGCLGTALDLIDVDPKYRDVFAYVLGSTLVFATLSDARRYLGDYRMVTLEGDLLEASGAMTGGSSNSRSSLHFGTVDAADSSEVLELRDRLQEIDRILTRCETNLAQVATTIKQHTQALNEARQHHRTAQLQADQLHADGHRLQTELTQTQTHLAQNQQALTNAQARLQTLAATIPPQEATLHQQRQALADLEQSQTHSEWQHLQAALRTQEADLQQKDQALRSAEQRLQDLQNQHQRIQEKIQQIQERLQDGHQQHTTSNQQLATLAEQQITLQGQVAATQADLAAIEQRLGHEKTDRDRCEQHLRNLQTQQQQATWQRDKLQETQQALRERLLTLQANLETQHQELPNPLPDVPEALTVEQVQQEVRSLQKRLQAMEPVNMLALEEHERTQARLEELAEKLHTLQEERTELLLRIENFTTLRHRAFREAFDAVNENFQGIFATLSDGDGYLQLEDPNDPFNGGLTLVAHPKGKPVQRLASMSGGEKSLTALSFIFALQRYRPSPFYAFDEVDMFLDGANVERLARMIKQQAQQAQFIVVSLRRPMIESSQRTIGVTQARGAFTQVLGINLASQSASV